MSYTKRVLLCILLKTLVINSSSCLGLVNQNGKRKVNGDIYRTEEKIIVVLNILTSAFESAKMQENF